MHHGFVLEPIAHEPLRSVQPDTTSNGKVVAKDKIDTASFILDYFGLLWQLIMEFFKVSFVRAGSDKFLFMGGFFQI